MRIQDVLDMMVELAPPRLAADWDNVGLMVGDPTRELAGVAVAVDPTYECVEEAIRRGANLLITHHPLLFKAPKSLDLRKEPGRTIALLIRHDVALYAAHTNLDVTAVNVALAEQIGLVGHRVLDTTGRHANRRLGVFVPLEATSRVQEAAWSAGAGRTEGYERASYAWEADGTFRPMPGADPAEGEICEQSTTRERRIEFLVPARRLEAVLAAIRDAHPYEEPAMDVVVLENGGEPYGFGLVGELSRPEPLHAFAARVKQRLGLDAVRVVGAADRPIRTVAWLGGSGGDYWKQALAAGADAYITGEVRHHAALDGLAAGLCFVEVGHVGSEQPVVPYLRAFLAERLGAEVPVTAIDQVDPFVVVR